MPVGVEVSGVFERRDIAGRSVEMLVKGSGRPLLYLHAGDGIEPSLGFVEALAGRFEVVAPSHPGFGGTDLSGSRDIHDLAYHYLDLIDAMELKAPMVAGSSFGGWIAAEMAVRAPEQLGPLVLIDAVGVKTGAPDEREIADIFSMTPQALQAAAYKTPPPLPVPADLDAARRIARNRESLSLFGWSPTLHNPRLARWLHRINRPTLVLWGDDDRIVTPDYGRAYAKAIPGGRFQLIEGAGHFPEREQQDRTVTAIEMFAGSHARVQASAR